jgi:hypothetical protein
MLKRVWFMLLLCIAVVSVLWIPYHIITGHGQWKAPWPPLVLWLFWLGMGWYSYMMLFSPQFAEEERQEIEQRRAIPPNTLGGLVIGVGAGIASLVLVANTINNDPKSIVQIHFDLPTVSFFVVAGAIMGVLWLRR